MNINNDITLIQKKIGDNLIHSSIFGSFVEKKEIFNDIDLMFFVKNYQKNILTNLRLSLPVGRIQLNKYKPTLNDVDKLRFLSYDILFIDNEKDLKKWKNISTILGKR